MRRSVLCVLMMLTGLVPASAVEQSATARCTPIESGNSNVPICPDVDRQAMKRLNELLDLKNLTLQQKAAEANEWARNYKELNAQFEETKKQLAAAGEDPTLVQTAQNLLHRGKLEEAGKVYDRLIASDEGNVELVAQDYFDRAIMFELQFRLTEALADYAKAFQYRPDNPRYAHGYAYAAHRKRKYAEAEQGWVKCLQLYREIAARNPGTYRPDVAGALNNLGDLYRRSGRLAEAEKAHAEALAIYRDLAIPDPEAYRPNIALTLNNLGDLYRDTGRLAEAERAYTEALAIYRDLATRDPGVYRPNIAVALNNLGYLRGRIGQFAEAEKAYTEALAIYRGLVTRDPGAYRPNIALTLNNLGNLHRRTGRLAEAERAYTEALAIYRDLAVGKPGVYTVHVAVLAGELARLKEKP